MLIFFFYLKCFFHIFRTFKLRKLLHFHFFTGLVKRKSAFENAQSAQIQIILRMRKLSIIRIFALYSNTL